MHFQGFDWLSGHNYRSIYFSVNDTGMELGQAS